MQRRGCSSLRPRHVGIRLFTARSFRCALAVGMSTLSLSAQEIPSVSTLSDLECHVAAAWIHPGVAGTTLPGTRYHLDLGHLAFAPSFGYEFIRLRLWGRA